MNKISKIFFFVLIFLHLVSCNKSKELKNNSFELSGTISNSIQPHLILSEVGKSGFTQNDTIPIDNKGKFSKNIEMTEPTLYSLALGEEYIIICPMVGEKITIRATENNFAGSYNIEGSAESELLKELNKENYNVRLSLKSMSEELKQADSIKYDSIRTNILEKYISTKQYQEKITTDFINNNPGSLTTLIALYRTFDGIPLFDYRQSLEMHKKVLQALEQTLPENQHTLILKNFIKEKEQTQITNGNQ
jgi:hypothetical protein